MKPGINRIILSLALLMLFLLPAAGKKSEKKDSLKVTANLSGKIKNIKNKELVLTFSDDMLPFGGERDGKTILFITPKVKGEYLWRGAKTLVLKPEKQFAYSTRYKVTVKRGTASLNNKKLKKKFRLTFITPPQPPKPALQPKWIYFSNTRRPIYRMNRINDVPVDKPLRLVFAQPVSYKEVANEIVVMENTSNTPLKITCSQKTENAVVIHFLKPLKKASLYKVLLKKKLTGSTRLNRSRKDFYFYLKTREIFKVSSYPNYIQKEIKEIRVTFNFALKRIAKKNIRVYILRKGKPKVPCQFDVSTLSAKLDISISEPLTDGESLEIILDKAIGCVLGESLENDVHFTVKVCSVIPEIYPALKQEEPELYLSGVDNINYSFIKYKDSILDQLSNTQYRTREEIRALFEDKNNIEKEYTTRHRCENGESARLPLLPIEQKNDPQNKSRFQEGLFAYKVNHLEAQSKCDDTKLTNRVENVTNRLKLVYKRELDFVVRAGYKRTLVWVFNNKTAKGVPNTDVFLLRKTTEYPATQSSQSSKSTPSTPSTQSTKSTMSTTTATKKTDQEKKPAKKNRLNKRIQIGKTNNEGVCIGKVTVKKGDLIVAIDPKTNRKSFYRIGHGDNFYFDSEEEREKKKEYLLEVFTDRVLYRPGSTVHIGGVIKIFENGKITTPQLKHATLIVNSEDDETLKKEEVTLDEFGGFATTCPLGEECKKGEYTIYIDIGEKEEFGEAFLVDYYQPDAIKLEISEEKKVYGKNDIFNPLISGSYYSGNPMSGDALNYHISFDDYDPFTGKGDLEEYSFGIAGAFIEYREKIKKEHKLFDDRGNFRPAFNLSKIKPVPYIRAIDLDVNAETEEGKEANQKMHAHYFPADRAVGLRIPYRIETGKPIPVNVAVIDSTCKPAETRAKLSVYERNYWALGESDFRGDWKAWKKIKEYNGLTFKGKDTVTLDGLTTGDYLLKCDAIDNDGDILTTSKEFSVGYIRAYFSDDELTLKAHKARVPGEKFITLSIKAPKKGTALLTIENKKSLGYHLVTLETPHVNQKIRLPIEENYFPTVKIKAFALYEDGTYEKDSIWLAIPETKKKLNVEILPEAKELLPSTQSKLAVKVTDNQGRGKKTGVFVFAVNEATLRLTEWGRFTDLLEEFYHYNHWLFLSDMTTLVSLTQNNLYPALSASMWRENAGCIIGRITTQNGTPLPGVTVYQKGPTTYRYTAAEKKKSLSNKNGFFFLLGSRKGNYELEFKKAGYKKSSLKVRLAEHDVEEVNVTLKEKETVKEAAGAEKQKKTAAKKKFSSLARKWKITGKLLLEDGNYIPGAFAELYRRTGDQSRGVARTVTSENGDFLFDNLPKGDYLLIFQLDGFKKSFQRLQITNSDVTVNVFMETGRISEEIMVMAAGATSIAAGEEPENTGWNSSEFRDLLRKDFKENLFFQILETDETGKAELIFKTSDTLSTYEITALAYGEDIFGKAKNKIQVTRDLYLEETMPEFARKEDRFRAGVQVSNRTADTLNVEVKLKVEPPQGRLAVRRPDLKDTTLATVPSKGNKPVYYDFLAADAGEAALHFYARAGQAKDALLKKFSIFDTEVTETILDFDNGKTINKQIEPTELTKNGGRLNLTLAPSILKPAGRIARKLIFYSYECMEQRASKVMPFLMLDDRMLTVPGIEIDSTQVRESIEAYIKIIPEYMNSQGALSYYRRGRFSNDYLTIYVYWSLQLARERGIATEAATGIIKKIETYVTKTKLSNNESCFYQYVLSRNKKANPRKLKAFYKKRDTLPLMARVFLYRAINNQLKRSRKKTKRMVAEFRNSLNIEADFAYFDAGDYSYSRHWPFYSNRFATALLLQAILEVEGAFEEAPRVIRWLLEVPTYMWETTQTNFWILSAMKQYSLTVEKKTAGKAEIAIAGETIAKTFTSKKENWEVEKKLEKEAKPFNVDVKADGNVYLTMELEYPVDGTRAATRGIKVQRNVYNKKGKRVEEFIKGATYQVELLVDFDKMLPYGVIDEPLAAGFELLREDFATTRDLEEFNTVNEKEYDTSYWVRREHSADRLIYYSYRFSGNKRFVYFIKALYSGTFTWMPTKVQGMYHPQYFGRTAIRKIEIKKTSNSHSIKDKR